MAENSLPRRWWLAPPGTPRRVQFTAFWLLVLGLLGVAAGLVASSRGASSTTSLWVGIGVVLGVEVVIFAVPVRISAERRFTLPARPDRVFAVAVDPALMSQFSPIGARLVSTSGDIG